MKTGNLIALLLCGATFGAQAAHYVFVANDARPETRMCVAAGNDQAALLRREMLYYNASIRYTANMVVCNGKSIALFANQYGAEKTYNLLIPYTKSYNKNDENVTISDLASHQAPAQNEETVYVVVSSF